MKVSTVAFCAVDAPRGDSRSIERSRTIDMTARRADVARCSASTSLPIPETGINRAFCIKHLRSGIYWRARSVAPPTPMMLVR